MAFIESYGAREVLHMNGDMVDASEHDLPAPDWQSIGSKSALFKPHVRTCKTPVKKLK
jgi:hypothetical protein